MSGTRIKRISINSNLLFIIIFFNFLGYYASILLMSNFIGFESSRFLTVPLRILIVFSIFLLFIINLKQLLHYKVNVFFGIFTIIFLIRLFIDYNLGRPYYMSIPTVLFYFLSFCVIPYYFIGKVKFSEAMFKTAFNSLLYGGFFFSVLVLFYYGKYIGEVSRLGKGTVNELVINPLALSYSSVLIIGVLPYYLVFNKISKSKKLIAFVTIGLAVVPFFLGASRGSLLALVITVVFFFLAGSNFKTAIKTLFLVTVVVGGLVFLDDYFKSGLLDRVFAINEEIEDSNAGAARIEIWKNAYQQFENHPIMGDKLEVDNWESYAHNILIESLQTTGLLGFIPLLILFSYIWLLSFRIAKYQKKYFWVVVIFIQAFTQAMFSGAIFISSWLWMSMALVLTTYNTVLSNNKRL